MKKMITMLLVVVMLVACMATTAFAAKAGDQFTVDFKVSGNPGFGSYNATISYDSDALELVSVTEGAVTAGKGLFIASGANIGFSALNNATADGVLFTATFKIKDTAAEGKTYNVTAAVVEGSASNAAGESVSFSISGGSVKLDDHEHTWGEWAVTKEATCGAEGEKARECACGEKETEVIPATGEHTWGEAVETKAPTCGAAGEKTSTCTVCGETKVEEVPATGEHTWGEWVVTKEATCTAKGSQTRTCSVCGETETETIKALGHDYENNGVCANCGNKKPSKPSGGDMDDVADTGDITPMITMGVVAVIGMIAAAAYVTKRRITK